MRLLMRCREPRRGWLWPANAQVAVNRFHVVLAALLLGCGWNVAAQAADLRVSYAEPMRLQQVPTPQGQQKPSVSRLTAFGRDFDLILEDNGRLLRKLPAAARQKTSSLSLMRGTVRDAPGSWVRLTLRDGAYDGAIWDGTELYLIEARASLEPALQQPSKDPAARSFIYRLSDTQGGLTAKSCALDPSAQPINKPLTGYRGLVSGLKTAMSAQLATATREIEVSMVGDYEYTTQQGPNALTTMVSLMNIVDGIFSEQVGVSIVPTDFTTFAVDNDPFSGVPAQSLLDQLSAMRSSSPVLRSSGLTHLLTGRNLLDTTVGIAFLGSLCDASAGVSLSESSHNMDSALIIAHELGHNFGAPHDGEGGSSCGTTPRDFLMAPDLNGSSTFSSCSLEKMQPHIAGAACIVNSHIRDVAVTVPPAPIHAQVNQPFDVMFDVTSVGEADAGNIVLAATMSSFLVVDNAMLEDVPCRLTGSAPATVNCEVSQMPVGESRRLTITAHSATDGNAFITAQVTSTNDSISSNNTVSALFNVGAARDLLIAATPQPLNVVVGQPFDVDVAITASGTQPVENVRVQLGSTAEILASEVLGGAACTPIACDIGTLAAAQTQHIHLQMVAHNVGSSNLSVNAFPQTGASFQRSANINFTSQAARDISVTLTPASRLLAVGVDAPYSVEVKSNGVQSVANVQVRIGSNDAALVVQIDGAIASACTITGGFQLCNLGTMAPGATQTIQVRAQSARPMQTTLIAHVVLPAPDDSPSNDDAQAILDIRVGGEVAIRPSMGDTPYDQRTARLNLSVDSNGANPVDVVTALITLPAEFSIQDAQIGGTQCTVQANVATCSAASIPAASSATIALRYTAPAPGIYTGSASVSASSDSDPTNNSVTLTFNVQPSVDGSVQAAPSATALTDQPVDLVFNVVSNRYALVNARLTLAWFAEFSDVTATSQLGTCTVGTSAVMCDLGLVPANSSIPVTLHFRASAQTFAAVSASLTSATDVDFSNNTKQTSLAIYAPGDVSVSVVASSATATAAQSFTLPEVDIAALRALPVAEAFVEFAFDPALATLDSFTIGNCGFVAPVWRCPLGNLGIGETRSVAMSITPRSAGTFAVTVRTGAANDTDASNNQQVINVTVQAAPVTPPPTPPPAGGSSGGGGGGSIDWLFSLTLSGLLFAAARSRRPISPQPANRSPPAHDRSDRPLRRCSARRSACASGDPNSV